MSEATQNWKETGAIIPPVWYTVAAILTIFKEVLWDLEYSRIQIFEAKIMNLKILKNERESVWVSELWPENDLGILSMMSSDQRVRWSCVYLLPFLSMFMFCYVFNHINCIHSWKLTKFQKSMGRKHWDTILPSVDWLLSLWIWNSTTIFF